ncbi:FAD:protein FMN transferase [Tabrizicola sp.]|uniref:FAD:protein FMN transferase n=1 Tax=Tabrizicola sp. TaxID=2005166 RepID=UPI003F2B776B
MNRRRFLCITAAATLPFRAAAQVEWQGTAFGVKTHVTLQGPAGEIEGALEAVKAEVARIESLFSLYDPGAALVRLNRDGRVRPDPDMLALLALVDRMHRATGGRFDPTVQPLWRALAEGGDPEPARALIGWDGVAFDAEGVRLGPGQQLTLNGIAQGWAADRIRALLAVRGFTHALVDMGELAALGGPWAIGLEDPILGLHAQHHITGTALATSSPAALSLGGGETHILGPRGERPLWSSITVEHDRAAEADALSTALCLMPEADIRRLAVPGLHRVVAVTEAGEVATLLPRGT